MAAAGWSDTSADLLLGGRCVGCARPGRAWCRDCRAAVRPAPAAAPTPGRLQVVAGGAYRGPLRAALLAHKERRVAAVRPTLAAHLAAAIGAALPWPGIVRRGDVVLLVPVPSRLGATLRRGEDPLRLLLDDAQALLCAALPAAALHSASLLRVRPGVRDQAGLGRAARADNLAGALASRPAVLRRVARRLEQAHVLLVDDVVTTGATLREADRALRAVGVRVSAAAVVAAAQRHPGRQPPPHPHAATRFHTTSSAVTLPRPGTSH